MAETDEDKIDGVLFGILIKKLRIERDMGSIELAILAFDDESKHTRISEYENGKVKSPRAKTLEPICLALDIEIEKLPVLLKEIKQEIETDVRSSVLRFIPPNLRPLFSARAKVLGYTADDYAKEVLSKVSSRGTIASIKPKEH